MNHEGLSVDDIAVERGGREVLTDLTFHVPCGTALSVTGQNGAGKSTLLRALAGLLPPTKGSIKLRPRGVSGEDGGRASLTHYLGHADGLKLALSTLDNLTFYARWAGATGVAPLDALAALQLQGLADLPAGLLSAGQRRRVSLARFLVSYRPLWLLDEPTTALDSAAEAMLGDMMADHLATGGLIVAATHAALPFARSLQLDPA